jgi:tetratricopeptide (TPR) repeat protein
MFLAAGAREGAESSGFASARALFESGRFPEARLAFEKLLATSRDDPDVHYYLGQLALRRADTDTAVGELERAEQLAPGSARVHDALGNAYGMSAQKAGILRKFGLARKCVAEFQRAAALEPGNIGYHESLLEFYTRAPSTVGGGSDKAAREAAIIVKLDPNRGHLAVAALYLSSGKTDLALAELDQVLKTKPQDYAALFQVGRLAAVSGRNLDRGLASLRTCLTLPVPQGEPSHAAAQWRRGNILERMGNPAAARAAYEEALKMDPGFTRAADSMRNLK